MPGVASPVTLNPMSEAVRGYYDVAKGAPIWTGDVRARERADLLLDALFQSPMHGLTPGRYRAAELRVRHEAATSTEAADAKLERDLSAAFLAYARDMKSGAVDPENIDARIHVDPARPDLYGLLQGASQAADIEAYLATLAPELDRYQRLRSRVADLMRIASTGGWGPRVDSQMLAPGDFSVAVTALRRRLMAMGDLPFEPVIAAEDGPITRAEAYDDRLEEAVARFQTRHGLAADGIAGPATLRALNEPIQKRLAQAMLNLERLRWRAQTLRGRRIEVNQPDFRMSVFGEDGTRHHEARVIVGQSERRLQTPEFSDYLSFLVLNPTWTVPKSIIWREMLPELKKDPEFLSKNNMILLRGGEPVDPSTVEWEKLDRETVAPYAVVQKPGPGNALGNVKFMFPNGFNVYLHDTPGKHLFDEGKRNFSHGCVRLERPFALAWYLLAGQEEDPGALIESILAEDKETTVPLDAPIPIHLVYFTAWVDTDGVLHFRDDLYGRDAALASALHEVVSGETSPGL